MVCTYFNVVITGYNFPCDGSCIKCLCAQLLCAKNELVNVMKIFIITFHSISYTTFKLGLAAILCQLLTEEILALFVFHKHEK